MGSRLQLGQLQPAQWRFTLDDLYVSGLVLRIRRGYPLNG